LSKMVIGKGKQNIIDNWEAGMEGKSRKNKVL
jgi:hypothetical protein